MNRPYIFCHMMTSLDGKIMGDYMETSALFSTRNGFSTNNAKGFILENAEVKDGGSVWLRYKTK